MTAQTFVAVVLPLPPLVLLGALLAVEYLTLHLLRGARRKRD